MTAINLKANHKVVKNYYAELNSLSQLDLFYEGAVSPAFAALLRSCARQFHWTLAEQYRISRGAHSIVVDGALLDAFKLLYGVWEAKDTEDDLDTEVKKKFDLGYPKDNILFQAPDRVIVYQNAAEIFDEPVSKPDFLVEALKVFFDYQPPAFEQWQKAVEEFKIKVPELAAALLDRIEKERPANRKFVKAFDEFSALCHATINPNLSVQAVEEMLIQHILTERIFRKVFDNPDFADRNIIAREIEKVVRVLTSEYFDRHEFMKPLDRFYGAIETTAAMLDDFSEKQHFLNTVYEKFFQGFSVKVADTHGIVYTPQPIVDFMVRSVEDILAKEFGRSLSDEGVHIIDPFVGTGNFIVRIMREIKRTALPHKYANDLHCNEVMLLPYYIASLNIEHAYYELTREYRPFDGICLVDTFELAEEKGKTKLIFTEANTERIIRQQKTPIFVIIGNPPYNAGQVNENDNNKNRKYPVMDKRVAETYAKDSKATNKNALSDPYVKAIRWACDRIGQTGEGIVAFVSNNSFLNNIAFDGMRKHLAEENDAIYVMDLTGNVRKNPKLSGTTHNVFGIQVGVSINLFVKKKGTRQTPAKVFYARTEENWRKEQKYDFLDEKRDRAGIEWEEITPDRHHTWLTEGLQADFETFLPLGVKEDKGEANIEAIFTMYSNGVKTNRDPWAYNFDRGEVAKNMERMIETYNDQVRKWRGMAKKPPLDDFVLADDTRISWSEGLKNCLKRGLEFTFEEAHIRETIYRPFTRMSLYFAEHVNERRYQMPYILPSVETEKDNRVIWLKVGGDWPVFGLMVNAIPDLLPQSGSQCFPFYTYNEDGTGQRENVTDWAMAEFRSRYKDKTISKWDIFHYVYAVLHHPDYRKKYAENLKRELPRIPLAPDFRAFADAGARLAEIHVRYEDQAEYPLQQMENKDVALNWRVEKMKLSKDKTQIVYNDFLTLGGIPPATFGYRLGNRSAPEWVIDQYRVKSDKRSGIPSDPNRKDDPRYIVSLIGKVVTVSLETMKVVKALPELAS
ncbi:MAG: type ISP restriction/modification enzyme [Planctomycetota bacterium]